MSTIAIRKVLCSLLAKAGARYRLTKSSSSHPGSCWCCYCGVTNGLCRTSVPPASKQLSGAGLRGTHADSSAFLILHQPTSHRPSSTDEEVSQPTNQLTATLTNPELTSLASRLKRFQRLQRLADQPTNQSTNQPTNQPFTKSSIDPRGRTNERADGRTVNDERRTSNVERRMNGRTSVQTN